ncbi:MAG: TonB-dependent receptor [Methylocystaceae bacterium]|nr:MAG: TonB-dependent receptor [Methylocystaceae bacterium]
MSASGFRSELRRGAGVSSLVLAFGGLFAAPLSQAHAEEAVVDDVAVTARHREEKNQDVPLPVSTVGGKTLDKQQMFRVQDYATKIPNFVGFQSSGRISVLNIRGLGGNANIDGSEPGVGLIVDNVFFTHVGFSFLDFVDLDHIEVVRGPQGTLLGKNTTIGSLVVTTKLPSFVRQTTVETGFGSRRHGEIRLNTTGSIVDDALAYRVTFYGEKSDGWIDNQFNGQKLLDNNRFGIRGQLLLLAGSDITDRLIVEHHGLNEYNTYLAPSGDPTFYADGVTPRAGWARKLVTLFGYLPSFDTGKAAASDSASRTRQDTNGVSNQLDWRIGDHTLTSISAWRSLRFRPLNPRGDSDLSPIPVFGSGYDLDVDQYSQELRIASPAGQTLEYQFGFYALKEYVFSNYRTIFGPSGVTYFTGTNALPAVVLNGVEYDQYGKATTTSGAVFGQATWHVTDEFALTVGLRDTLEKKQGSNTAYAAASDTLSGALNAARVGILNNFGGTFALADAKTTNSIAWLVNPSYKFNDNILAYFAVAQGEKSGAVNTGAAPDGSGGAQPVIILPEKATDFELGLKTSWLDGAFVLNGNLYWEDVSNYQANAVNASGTTLKSYLTNVGKVRVRGVEIEGRYSPVENLWLTFSGAYNDARYLSFTNAPPPAELYGGAGTPFPAGVKTVDLSGRRIVNAPAFNGQLGLTYEHPVDLPFGYHAVGFVWATQTYRTKISQITPVSAYGWQSAYGLTNLGVGVRSDDDKYSFQIWVKNLTDRTYSGGAGRATSATPYTQILGEPRTIGGTLKVTF